MSEAKYTPGPWNCDQYHPGEITAVSKWPEGAEARGIICTMNDKLLPGFPMQQQQEANARLIAAAPDLLAACKAARIELAWLKTQIHWSGSLQAAFEKLQAAEAQAKGGA
jgi:hypothetical protein